jgi:transcriptional regulator with XRE-family HTH domain
MKKEMRRLVGQRLRQARINAKLTQQDVAGDFGRSRQSISSWESGKTLPDLIEFRQLATLYGVSTDLILYGLYSVTAAGQGVVRRAMSAQVTTD